MTNYGLNSYQIQKAKDKLTRNKEFMRSNGIQLDDKIIPFSDFVSNSYINSDRYIAELQHRAWSVHEYAVESNLKNVFLTLTLPSKWHSMKKAYNSDKYIANPKFGGRKYICNINQVSFLNAKVTQNIPYIEPILCFKDTIDKYTPRNASKELSRLFKKFFDDRSYKSIDKDKRCYFRVTEPHKDGTPHVHMSLNIPNDKVDSIVKSFERLFPAPQGKIETDIKKPVSYLMKYVLKTLDDLRDDNEKITNLSLWYLYHGISRFYTSRTFVSLEVYRKLNGMYTLRDLTKNYLSEDLSIYINTETNKIAKIENEFGTLYTPKPVNWYEKLIDTDHTYLEAEFETVYKEDEIKAPMHITIDDEDYIVHNHDFLNMLRNNKKSNKSKIKLQDIMRVPSKQPHQMGNYELQNHFNSIDIDTINPARYAVTRNLMIDRGLIQDDKLIPSDMYEAFEVF